MNREDAYDLLINFLGEFPNVVIMQQFIKDFSDILNNQAKGTEKKLLAGLVTLLSQVKEYGYKIVTINGHEQLKKYNSLISLHLRGKTYNVRILATIKNDIMYFLLAFDEKSGKKSSAYSSYANIALKRLEQINS